jgi:hypothetical protein
MPRGYERIRECELTGLEFRSSNGTVVWPEELEDLVCDVTCAIVTVILIVLELIAVTSGKESRRADSLEYEDENGMSLVNFED